MAKHLTELPPGRRQTTKQVQRDLEIGQKRRNDQSGKEITIKNIYRKEQRVLAKPAIGDPFFLSFAELKSHWRKV